MQHTNREIFEFFQSRLSALSAETALKYRRTLSELDCYMSGHRLRMAELSPQTVVDWAVSLLMDGTAVATVVRHLNTFSSMVKSAAAKGLMEPCAAPRELARTLTEPSFTLPLLMNGDVYNHILTTLRRAANRPGANGVCSDMLLFSLLNGAMPMSDVVNIKAADIASYTGFSRTLLERNSDSRRRFVFDLKQSYRTDRQIQTFIADGMKSLLGHAVLPDDFAKSMWAAIAVRNGASASEALGCVSASAPYALPQFCTPASDSLQHKPQWMMAVEAVLSYEKPKWYVMRLRPGVSFDTLKKEISDTVRPLPELFYPCETIKRQIGKKTVMEEHPFISGTVFFRTHPEAVLPMFRIIGDKAWCYRLSNSSDSPYATIPPREMKRFQCAIGVFTSDTEIRPLGTLSPKPGESVIVIRAGYENREGTVEDIVNTDSGTAIFRVKLTTEYGYEWRMTVDGRQLQRIVGA